MYRWRQNDYTMSYTYWYHSHSHQQYADELIRPINIDPKQGEQDPYDIVALPTPTIGHLGNSYETYIEYLEYGNVYEVLLVNTDTHPHPFHLHGCFVNFTTFDTLVTQISDHYDECNEYRFDMTIVKYDRMLPPYDQVGSILSVGDSFTVPSKGYVVFRFKANNPSPWLSHCYMEWHIFPVWHWFSQLVTKMGNHITN
ncbi:unnamed protein product [Rotaria socialis]|uniref:Plastocyanin-like domain-containing protein n=1 Tax=Rotaria socialis TaxID=392032 RepID=A0A817TRD1_9BILA|nr:unnamed protein product [Rotaria socialis]